RAPSRATRRARSRGPSYRAARRRGSDRRGCAHPPARSRARGAAGGRPRASGEDGQRPERALPGLYRLGDLHHSARSLGLGLGPDERLAEIAALAEPGVERDLPEQRGAELEGEALAAAAAEDP